MTQMFNSGYITVQIL